MKLCKTPFISRKLGLFFTFIFFILILMLNSSVVKAAVTLIYFRPTYSDGKVYFEWKTASEIDSSGFAICKLKEGGVYTNVQDYESLEYEEGQDFYPSYGEGGEYHAEYYNNEGDLVRFYDENVIEGKTYWYRLKMIDVNNVNEYSEPESVFIGQTPTPTRTQIAQSTATPTPTITLTKKPTKTKSASEKTNTPYYTATKTYIFLAATATQPPPVNNTPTSDLAATEAAQTNEASQATILPTATATLIPLPSITILFPTAAKKGPTETMTESREDMRETNSNSWLTPQRIGIILVIAVIWIMLGVWFYLSFKHLEK